MLELDAATKWTWGAFALLACPKLLAIEWACGRVNAFASMQLLPSRVLSSALTGDVSADSGTAAQRRNGTVGYRRAWVSSFTEAD